MEMLISVILPIHRKSNYLSQTLKALCSQFFKKFEVIVINDSNYDYSKTIASFSEKLKIKYIANDVKVGIAASLNKGLSESKGDYICYLDEGTIYYENHLSTLAKKILESDSDIVYSNGIKITKTFENYVLINTEHAIYPSELFCSSRICHFDYIPLECLIHKKSCLGLAGKFNESLTTHAKWDFTIRLSRYYEFNHIDSITFRCLSKTSDSKTSSNCDFDRVRKLGQEQLTIPNLSVLVKNFSSGRILKSSTQNRVLLSIIIYLRQHTNEILNDEIFIENKFPSNYELIYVIDGNANLLKNIPNNNTNTNIIFFNKPVGRVLANNFAARSSKGIMLLFISGNIEFEKNSIEEMLDISSENANKCIVSLPFHNGNQKYLVGGFVNSDGLVRWNELIHDELAGINSKWVEVDCCSLHCMLLPKLLFNKYSEFSLKYAPEYYEDAALCTFAKNLDGIPTLIITAHKALVKNMGDVKSNQRLANFNAFLFCNSIAKNRTDAINSEEWVFKV